MILFNLGDQPCDTSVDWCGWKNIRGWKRVKYQDLDEDDSHVKDIENDGGNYFKISNAPADLNKLSLFLSLN